MPDTAPPIAAPSSEQTDTAVTLLAEYAGLPAIRSIALRVMQMVDDEEESAATIAACAASDPGLSARLLRVANSAVFSLTRRVASVDYAVVVVGLSTVRSLAAVSAVEGVMGDNGFPPGFWEHAMSTAAAAGAVARLTGVDRNDAFSAGVLHDLGSALLFRTGPARYGQLAPGPGYDGAELCRREEESYGVSHAALAGRLLVQWRVPESLCDAVWHHHDAPSTDDSPLLRCLRVGEIVADRLDAGYEERPATTAEEEALLACGLDAESLPAVVRDVRAVAHDLISQR